MAAPRSRLLRVLVTAGPTREHLDDVRFLSNGSTGRMGIELAREARRRAASVVLLLGPTDLEPPPGVRTQRVISTADLLRAARAAASAADVVFFAAAPADWAPARRLRGKPAKRAHGGLLRLIETADVAATLGRTKGRRLHVGFALESGPGAAARAYAKLARKGFDALVLNRPENMGRGGGRAQWLEPGHPPDPLPTGSKRALARAIWTRALRLRGRPRA